MNRRTLLKALIGAPIASTLPAVAAKQPQVGFTEVKAPVCLDCGQPESVHLAHHWNDERVKMIRIHSVFGPTRRT